MSKITLGVKNCLSPMPTVLAGANVNEKPNYLTIAWVGIMDHDFVSISVNKSHYSNGGIRQNGTFSINIPSSDQLEIVDYCGIVSGREVDKGVLFENFYGKLATAPMIRQCPVNMECKLVHTLGLMPTHDVFVGEIVETYCDGEFLKDGMIDYAKIHPILYATHGGRYWELGARGERIGSPGKKLKKQMR
jgi:flavin reductase (DIM6/NTAB) family NADH-FMN oxidoreductase RutF